MDRSGMRGMNDSVLNEHPDLKFMAEKFFEVNQPTAREYRAYLDGLAVGFGIGKLVKKGVAA